jgi:pyruvate/2-oxoglutarate dehydrogenase complex dihydrolipoamide dehydrogenase (E3) component
MPETIKPDICIIGTAGGSVQAAMQAAALGVKVVLVDNDAAGHPSVGIRLPLSALGAAARHAHQAAQATAFGIQAKSTRVDYQRVRDHVHGVVAARGLNRTRERLSGLGVRVVEGAARFKDHAILSVAGEIEIVARRFIIATGSASALPPIAGLELVPHLTSETVFDLTLCPEHLLVIGGGSVGLEFAQAFRRFGAEVTMVAEAAPLAGEDPECAAVVFDQLAREGVNLRSGTIQRVENPLQLVFAGPRGEEEIEGSHLLVAGGRWPNVVGLGLDLAAVKYDEHGVAVDRSLKTTNPRIYAIGDVTGGEPSEHVAEHQAGLVVRNALFRTPVRFDPEAAPRVVFTDPELAQAGLTEAAARRRGHQVRVLRWPFRENDRAHVEGQVRGHIKIVLGRSGRILGATIVGAGAGEQISAWALAIATGIDIATVAGIMMPYPTMAAVGKRAATTYFMRGFTSSRLRRMIAWLRRLG